MRMIDIFKAVCVGLLMGAGAIAFGLFVSAPMIYLLRGWIAWWLP